MVHYIKVALLTVVNGRACAAGWSVALAGQAPGTPPLKFGLSLSRAPFSLLTRTRNP